MRVLLVAGGGDRPETQAAVRLATAGVEMAAVCEPDSLASRTYAGAGLPVFLHTFTSRLDWRGVGVIRAALRAHAPDIVHAFTNRALACALLATRGRAVRVVAYRGTMGHLSRWDPASWLAYLNPRIDRIICVSEAVRRYLLTLRLPPERLVTIHKGHALEWYEGLPCPPRATFGIPPDAFLVLFTGNMRPVKGVDVLLAALPLVPQHLHVHLLLVGELRDRRLARLAAAPELRGRVHLAGYRADAAGLARLADVFVMPSVEREGLPRAVIEAMAQGVPVVVTDVGGMPELVTDGETGRVVTPRDPAALAAALTAFAVDPAGAQACGARARAHIARAFSVETTTRKTLNVYQALMA